MSLRDVQIVINNNNNKQIAKTSRLTLHSKIFVTVSQVSLKLMLFNSICLAFNDIIERALQHLHPSITVKAENITSP